MKSELGMLLALASIAVDVDHVVDNLMESLNKFKKDSSEDNEITVIRDMSILMMKFQNKDLSPSQVIRKAMEMEDIAHEAMEIHKNKHPEDFNREEQRDNDNIKVKVTTVPMGKPGKA